MKIKKTAGRLAAVLLIISLAVVMTGATRKSKTLKVGVRGGFVNFSYYNETTEKYYGLEIDLAEALAKKMGYSNVEFVTVHAETREEALENGEVDCIIALYTITDERKELVDFSDPYYTDSEKLIVEKSSRFSSISDIVGKKIGIHEGSDSREELASKLVKAGHGKTEKEAMSLVEFVEMDTYGDMAYALEVGEVDGICMDGCIEVAYAEDGWYYLDDNLCTIEYGIATAKGSELTEKVNAALGKLIEDGTLDELKDKWD